ncbi:unnamed protein product [Hymenolepis diminuta]|uniref:PDZ domain-containing protein n=1 Tax=Hymenolepis diminuta TaxID=6216 RepID=A0A0R3SKI1_HYMDI|nr:unnamed protein product [Hymenolepis diminuta]
MINRISPYLTQTFYQPEEDYVEIELIDFSKTRTGVGAFLTPGLNGIGARVERLAKGELAEKVSISKFYHFIFCLWQFSFPFASKTLLVCY